MRQLSSIRGLLCLALFAVCASLLLVSPASARQKHHNSDRGQRMSEVNPWDWHPGMLGDSRMDWRDEYADGLNFGIGGDGWGLSYNDGNTRFRYSRGGWWTRPGRSCPDYSGRSWRSWDSRGNANCERSHGRNDCYGYPDYGQVIVIDGYGTDYGYPYRQDQGYADNYYVDGQALRPGSDIYYDNSVTNNYYGDFYSGSPSREGSRPRVGPEPPATAPSAPERAMGQRFYEKTRLASAGGTFLLSLDQQKLHCGPEGSKPALVANNIDQDFGAFAAYQPGEGLSVIYVSAGIIYAAYETEAGKWWSEALPMHADLAAGLSLGLIGNEPWAAFSDGGGTRYVYSWSQHSWFEIGSASRS